MCHPLISPSLSSGLGLRMRNQRQGNGTRSPQPGSEGPGGESRQSPPSVPAQGRLLLRPLGSQRTPYRLRSHPEGAPHEELEEGPRWADVVGTWGRSWDMSPFSFSAPRGLEGAAMCSQVWAIVGWGASPDPGEAGGGRPGAQRVICGLSCEQTAAALPGPPWSRWGFGARTVAPGKPAAGQTRLHKSRARPHRAKEARGLRSAGRNELPARSQGGRWSPRRCIRAAAPDMLTLTVTLTGSPPSPAIKHSLSSPSILSCKRAAACLTLTGGVQ